MFKKYMISMVMLWIVFIAVFWGMLHTFSPEAQMAYQRLVSNREQFKKEHMKEKALSTQQIRYQVSKQILYKKDSQRLQSRLTSDYSELTFNPKEGEAELVEDFKGLTCAMQERIAASSKNLESKQHIRYFKAEKALYSYKSGQLEAEEVDMAQYLVPGLLWPALWEAFQPLLQGHAHKLELSLFKEPSLKAQGFQAVFCHWDEE